MRLALTAAAAVALTMASAASASGTATDGPGVAASWTTGNKLALGTSATTTSKVSFTVAKGITSEVFYPRADVPNMQDMQYVVTDGSTFVDLERDATNHVVSMPDEKSLEYTVTNTAKSGKYKMTNTYVTDPAQNTLLIKTRFQSLDGGTYRLYLLENPSIAGGGANDNAWWDGTNGALMASDTETLFGSTLTVDSALKVSSGFIAHDDGFSGRGSDCYVDLSADKVLNNQFDNVSGTGNAVQCGQIGVGSDTTFTVALGYGSDGASALAAANASLGSGFASVETSYRSGWNSYVNGLKAAPGSVSGDTLRRRAYYVALMALHAAEDKTYRGASVAGLATPWGDFTNGDNLNDGYHRVWGRDLYQQATGLLAAGDSAQALRMAQFMWSSQYIATSTPGDGTTYLPGSFPRYSPVSGVSGASPQQLGCCEQLDQDSFAILLAWATGLVDSTTYNKIKTTANHIQSSGPDTTDRWEEQYGKSPSSIAAEIAGLVAAADIARANGDTASASSWEATADSWRTSLAGWTFTTSGYWGAHSYYERIDMTSNPNDTECISFQEGCFYAHDVTDFGFLDLVRLAVRLPGDSNVSTSLSPTASASGGSATVYLQAMADSTNDGYFVPEQIWDRSSIGCFGYLKPTGSAAPLMWAEGQYLRLAQAMSAGYNADTPSVVRARYGGQVTGPIIGNGSKCVDDAGGPTANGTPVPLWDCTGGGAPAVRLSTGDGAIHVLGKCMDISGGGTTNGTKIQLWDCNGTGAQQWRYRAWRGLYNPESGRCLDDPNGNTANGTQLQIWDCNGTAAQVWRLP